MTFNITIEELSAPIDENWMKKSDEDFRGEYRERMYELFPDLTILIKQLKRDFDTKSSPCATVDSIKKLPPKVIVFLWTEICNNRLNEFEFMKYVHKNLAWLVLEQFGIQ